VAIPKPVFLTLLISSPAYKFDYSPTQPNILWRKQVKLGIFLGKQVELHPNITGTSLIAGNKVFDQSVDGGPDTGTLN